MHDGNGSVMSPRVKRLGVTILAALLILLVWGLIEPYFIGVENYSIPLANLPRDWNGRRVAVIGDTQIGMWLDNAKTVERAAEQLTEAQPDAVFLLGDFIYHGGNDPDRRIREVVSLLKPLTDTDIPVYAVLGNHDYSVTSSQQPEVKQSRASQLVAALEDAEIRVLQNEAVPLFPGGESSGEPLYLVGVGPHMPNKDRPQDALAAIPEDAPRIVIMHNPKSFAAIEAGEAPLAVAGHTHGGQIRLPFSPGWSLVSMLAAGEIHTDGWIDDYGKPGNRLYVNRGIGFSYIPIRINCRPEITYFSLRTAGDVEASGTSTAVDGQMAPLVGMDDANEVSDGVVKHQYNGDERSP